MARTLSSHRDELVSDPVGRNVAHTWFGGLDLPAAFVGMLASIALLAILSGIAAAVGSATWDVQDALSNADNTTVGTAIVALVILFASFFTGGWAAGRIARFDGIANGVFMAVLTVLFGMAVAAVTGYYGSEYDLVPNIDVYRYVDGDTLTTAAIVGGLIALAVMALSAALGGLVGERYNQDVDTTMLAHDGAAVAVTPVATKREDLATTVVVDNPSVIDDDDLIVDDDSPVDGQTSRRILHRPADDL